MKRILILVLHGVGRILIIIFLETNDYETKKAITDFLDQKKIDYKSKKEGGWVSFSIERHQNIYALIKELNNFINSL